MAPYRDPIPPLVSTDAKATVLFVSGLNNGRAVFRQAREALQRKGVNSIELCLHEEKEVKTLKEWRQQVKQGYEYACSLGRPVTFVGFSTGALLLLEAANTLPCKPVRIILLSPPFAVNLRSKLVQLFFPLRNFGVSLPSFAPQLYRARSWTSILSYHSLFQLIKDVQKIELSHQEIDIHAFFNPDDEFLDVEESIDIFLRVTSRSGLTHRISNTTRFPSHLLLDETTFGPDGWVDFIKLLT